MRKPSIRRRRLRSWRSALATCLHAATLLIAASAAAAQPTPVSADSTAGKASAGIFKDDTVAVIDTTTNRVLRTIAVPKGPHGLVMTPDGRKVYVSSDGCGPHKIHPHATSLVANQHWTTTHPPATIAGDNTLRFREASRRWRHCRTGSAI